MYGILIAGAGFTVYFFAVLLRFVGLLADPYGRSLALVRELVWYSGMPVKGKISSSTEAFSKVEKYRDRFLT